MEAESTDCHVAPLILFHYRLLVAVFKQNNHLVGKFLKNLVLRLDELS